MFQFFVHDVVMNSTTIMIQKISIGYHDNFGESPTKTSRHHHRVAIHKYLPSYRLFE